MGLKVSMVERWDYKERLEWKTAEAACINKFYLISNGLNRDQGFLAHSG